MHLYTSIMHLHYAHLHTTHLCSMYLHAWVLYYALDNSIHTNVVLTLLHFKICTHNCNIHTCKLHTYVICTHTCTLHTYIIFTNTCTLHTCMHVFPLLRYSLRHLAPTLALPHHPLLTHSLSIYIFCFFLSFFLIF